MTDYKGRGPETDYETDMKDNGVFRKGPAPVLDTHDQLRLLYKTGTIDPTEPDDGHASWNGQTRESIDRPRTRPSKARPGQSL